MARSLSPGRAALEKRRRLLRGHGLLVDVGYELLRLGIPGRADAGGRGREVVGGFPQRYVRPEQRPVRARATLVRHADTAGVDEALAVDAAVELDVRVAADDRALLDAFEHRAEPRRRAGGGDDLLIAARRAVAEQRGPEPVHLDGHGGRKRGEPLTRRP